jgi:hypothetical protein
MAAPIPKRFPMRYSTPKLASIQTTATLTKRATSAAKLNFTNLASDGRRELNVQTSLSM